MGEIVWRPSEEYVEKSNIHRLMGNCHIESSEELITRSIEHMDWFWEVMIADLGIDWFKPYEKVVDLSQGPSWSKWFVGGKINIVYNCLDRHVKSWRRNKVACIWEGESGEIRKLTYRDLYIEVNKLANGLKSLGIRKGDTVGIYMPMIPEAVIAILATLKIGAVCVPIFSGFRSSAVASRLENANVKVLFTVDGSLRKGNKIEIKKEADIAADAVQSIRHVIVYNRLGIEIPWKAEKDIWWGDLTSGQPANCETEWMDSEDISFLLYTSGTTGRPKGIVHTHAGPLVQCAKDLAYHFDLKDEDLFFWVTDIGWMMGPWMIIGCQCLGGTFLIYEGSPFYPAPDRLWGTIERHGVTIFGITPTTIRILIKHGEDWIKKHDLSSLRILGSTGEPWDPESWMWFFRNVGGGRCPIINISGGTELLAPHLSPLPISPLKPCTVGGPGLGMDVDVFDEGGKPVREEVGYLVMKKPSPSMTKGLWKDPERYLETYWSKWPNVWFHGDWAMVDKDGFWFVLGRVDDMIKVAGQRIGPAEIESALMGHPAVSEAVAIGVPSAVKGEAIFCFTVLKPGFEPSDTLREELKEQVGNSVSKTAKPEEIKFVKQLPKTMSGKILRRLIKAKLLGRKLEELSSLENPEALDEITKAI